ncbi:MAG: undecaprenyl-diphosphate phosphatase [Campylobacterales bacterium]|nr:undecaprenyl-diphosphate phosphatase [Campylobacterales bacterium]
MTLFDAVILGIIEGVTEYLPVSSTAHLVLGAQLLGLEQNPFLKAFEIIIQMAPIFAVMMIYRERLTQSATLWAKLIVAFIPTGIVGFLFHRQIEALFVMNTTVALMVLTGIAFLLIEYLWREKDHHVGNLDDVSYKQALGIGLCQTISLVPGISRSGVTILGAMLLGLKRESSMSFSFLLAIPTMGAASLYMLFKEYDIIAQSGGQIELLLVGFIVSFIVGYIAVKSFLAIVARYNFTPFGIYLVASGLLFGLFGVEL